MIGEATDQRKPATSALLLAGFVLAGAMPVVPPAWRWPVAPATVAVVLGAMLIRDVEAICLSLFCACLAVVPLLNPWPTWPMHLLSVLLVYGLLVGALSRLRRAIDRPPWGRFDRLTVGLIVLTVVGSSAALVAWYALLRPDVSDLRAMVPRWPTWTLPLAGLGFAVVNAVIEEAVWRWLLWRLLRRAVAATWLVVGLQAVSFGLAHIHGFPRGWIGVAMATLYAVFLGTIRHRSGGLAAVVVAHVFADAVVFAILVWGILG